MREGTQGVSALGQRGGARVVVIYKDVVDACMKNIRSLIYKKNQMLLLLLLLLERIRERKIRKLKMVVVIHRGAKASPEPDLARRRRRSFD